MDLQDGSLEVNLENRRKLVAEIRKRQPDIVVTFDPQTLIYDDFNYLNHPDHRAAGQLAVDAVSQLWGGVLRSTLNSWLRD